ncbi:MAG: hypothetical protein EA424_25150 [Planctomycetaceae bacterium]|nr:MAG: hypothetical protein EA424_25150 [Planctomycetaceae bacterium]
MQQILIGFCVTYTKTLEGLKNATAESPLVLAYRSHGQKYYVKDGKAADEQACVRTALRPLLDLYGPSAVSEFTPLALKACREQMIASGW